MCLVGVEGDREVRKLVARNGSPQGELPLVARVRKVLRDFSEGSGVPQSAAEAAGLPCGGPEPATIAGDLHEVQDRLRRLRGTFPDLQGVDVGPLVSPACDYFAGRQSGFDPGAGGWNAGGGGAE